MRLKLVNININKIKFSESTKIDQDALLIDKEGLKAAVLEDQRISKIGIDLVRPNDNVMIHNVKDVIEPSVKIDGSDSLSSNFLNLSAVGSGQTNVLKGVTVVITEKNADSTSNLSINMKSTEAEQIPFSKKLNIVISIEVNENLDDKVRTQVFRLAALRAGQYLGEAGRDAMANQFKVYEHLPLVESVQKYPDLIKVAYIKFIKDNSSTSIYGFDAKNIIPTLLSPTEIMDGAIISNTSNINSYKDTTYYSVNDPIIDALYQEHGKTLNFIGVIVSSDYFDGELDSLSYELSSKFIKFLGIEKLVICYEECNEQNSDFSLNIQKLNEHGVKTILIDEGQEHFEDLHKIILDSISNNI